MHNWRVPLFHQPVPPGDPKDIFTSKMNFEEKNAYLIPSAKKETGLERKI